MPKIHHSPPRSPIGLRSSNRSTSSMPDTDAPPAWFLASMAQQRLEQDQERQLLESQNVRTSESPPTPSGSVMITESATTRHEEVRTYPRPTTSIWQFVALWVTSPYLMIMCPSQKFVNFWDQTDRASGKRCFSLAVSSLCIFAKHSTD
uniref:Uncharacterized protein n=1 Tax=Spongospora subterranea TaxID=70186 RepID=A0A0H5R285_9EUKA|eukprot:CRZ01989.1 hypothetical protein [Spongospora subterranea]